MRKSKPGYECMEQIAIFEWLSYQGDIIKDCHHSPNEGKRSAVEGRRMKMMGLTPGFSDIFIAIPKGKYHGLFVELKSKRSDGKFGKPTKEQEEFIKRKNKMGYLAKVCYGMDGAISFIKDYLLIK